MVQDLGKQVFVFIYLSMKLWQLYFFNYKFFVECAVCVGYECNDVILNHRTPNDISDLIGH